MKGLLEIILNNNNNDISHLCTGLCGVLTVFLEFAGPQEYIS